VPYTKLRYHVGGGALITRVEPPANTYWYEMMRELDDIVHVARMEGIRAHLEKRPAVFTGR